MTTVKNMAYWRSKNKCGSKGSYDGDLPKLKAKRSPMKNYKNPQDYKVFNMGNEATPVKKKKKY